MSDVSVIGTGAMGSALVEALAASGADVAVWNRTKRKAEALSGRAVRVAESAAEALEASPLTIVVVSDHELARSLVETAGADLHGRVVASASFVTPEQARAFAAVVSAAGGEYLDLSIPAYPSEVRTGAGIFLVSGDRGAYEAHRERFGQIGRAAYISEMAVLLAYLPMAVGLLQGLRICAHHAIPLEWFNDTLLELYPFHIRSLLERVTEQPDPSRRRWRRRSTSGGRPPRSTPTTSGTWVSTQGCTTRSTSCSPLPAKPATAQPTGQASLSTPLARTLS